MSHHRTLRRWLWFLAAYLLVLYVMLALAGHWVPSPSDLGWFD